ncbi:DUF4286 family protein [uncultured Pseudacidovorax sp.]|uniref:DUF4286 family protein n=1 Tax=uncultured Pseudacidovorax sp. TaxID=679313 RepID=UPI0025EB47E8|nr:DUF4286 family protein [uncultured Pseudacidovorax sp.]
MADGFAGAGALLALWNDVDPEVEADYEDWHANEHVPERLTVPGILDARRYAAMAPALRPRYLTLYALASAEVLDSAAYRHLLANPTPASARMRPHLRNVARWVCRLHHVAAGWAEGPVHVRTGGDAAPMPAHAPASLLVAEHLPQAPGLPWMASGQASKVEGCWLMVREGASASLAADEDRCRPLPLRRARIAH